MMQLSGEQLAQVLGNLYLEVVFLRMENAALRSRLGPGNDGLPVYDMSNVAGANSTGHNDIA